MSKKFWRVENAVDASGATIYIDGPISSESWWGDEATPQQLRDELREITNNRITVVINSGGGDVWAGLAMYNALREHDAEITIRVDGLAASIASVIAMAGDKVIMSPGSMMMIHKASAWAGGNADELAKIIEMLETVEESIVPIYADRTGLDREKVQEMMNAETWMSAEEAVELGFADEVAKKVDDEQPVFAFSGKLALSMKATKTSIEQALHAKQELDAKKAEVTEVKDEVEEETQTEVEETNDSTDTTAPVDKTDEPVEAADAAETKPEAKAEVETQAEESKVTNSTKKEEVEMTKQAEVAQDEVVAVANRAPVEAKKPTVKQYLKTAASMDAFARILEENAGKESADVRNAWKEHLEAEMGVTNPEVFLPEPLITEIEDAFKQGGEIWNRVTKTGLDAFKAVWDIEDDVDSEDGRGRGYNRSVEADKAEQVLEFDDRTLRPQFVYKYITLNKEDVKNQRSTGALVRYVLSELPKRIVREVERAIIIGDGRAPGSAYKISSLVAVKADATADNAFATTYTPTTGENHYESLIRAGDLLEAEGRVSLIARKGYVTELKLQQNDNGGYMFPLGTNFADVLDLDVIVQPDWMESDADNDAYLVVLSDYKTVGDNTIEAFTNFTLKQNKQEYLQELWVGGGLTVRKSAVAIAKQATS